jgi:hypothetical protein
MSHFIFVYGKHEGKYSIVFVRTNTKAVTLWFPYDTKGIGIGIFRFLFILHFPAYDLSYNDA